MTTGNGEYELTILHVAADKLSFSPPGITVERNDLPADLKIDEHRIITVVRFTDEGFVIDDHRWPNIRIEVSLIKARGVGIGTRN